MWISMAIFAVGSWNPCFFSKQGTIPAGKSVCKGFPVNFDLVGQRLETISINLQTSKFDNIFKWKINYIYIYGVLWPANWNSELCTAILVGRLCQKSAHGYMRLNAELVNTSVGSNFGCDMTWNQKYCNSHIYISHAYAFAILWAPQNYRENIFWNTEALYWRCDVFLHNLDVIVGHCHMCLSRRGTSQIGCLLESSTSVRSPPRHWRTCVLDFGSCARWPSCHSARGALHLVQGQSVHGCLKLPPGRSYSCLSPGATALWECLAALVWPLQSLLVKELCQRGIAQSIICLCQFVSLLFVLFVHSAMSSADII